MFAQFDGVLGKPRHAGGESPDRGPAGVSPDAYRKKWGLAPDYPMVAPAYAAKRSAFAKQIGLGRKVRRDAP